MPLPTNVAPERRLFSPEAIANLRALTEANLPHLCTATAVPTIGGAPSPVLTNVPCRLVAMKRLVPQESLGAEALAADQPLAGDRWNLVFRVGVLVPLGALATVTGTDALGAPWSRSIRIGTPLHSRAFEIESRYGARDVRDAGIVAVFSYGTGTYDGLTGKTTGAATVPVPGRAIETAGSVTQYEALKLVVSKSKTLFWTPDTPGVLPPMGATIAWAGATYVIKDIKPVSPDGVAIAAWIVVSA